MTGVRWKKLLEASSFFFYLSCSIGRGSLLQQEARHFHLAVLGCHMQRAEPFLFSNGAKRHFINMQETLTEPRRSRDKKRGRKKKVLSVFFFFYQVSFLLSASF